MSNRRHNKNTSQRSAGVEAAHVHHHPHRPSVHHHPHRLCADLLPSTLSVLSESCEPRSNLYGSLSSVSGPDSESFTLQPHVESSSIQKSWSMELTVLVVIMTNTSVNVEQSVRIKAALNHSQTVKG